MANPGRRLPKAPPELHNARTVKELARIQADFNREMANSVRGAPAPHRLLAHSDGTDSPVARGALIKGSANKWQKLTIGGNRTFVRSNGTDLAWALIEFLDLPVEARGWTDDGTVVRLTLATDDVAIGRATPLGSAKLTIEGTSVIHGQGQSGKLERITPNASGFLLTFLKSRSGGAAAANDIIGELVFSFLNTTPSEVQGAVFSSKVLDPTAGSMDTSFLWDVMTGGGLGRGMSLMGTGLRVGPTVADAHSKLQVEGPIALAYVSTAIDLALDNTHSTVAVDTGAGNRIINLPTAVGIAGRVYTIKRITGGVNTLTVDASGAQTIDGNLTVLLPNQWDVLRIQSDNANWLVI